MVLVCSAAQHTDVEPMAGRIPNWDQSDNAFFGMHNKLATWTDPITKLGFERCFEAIIDAGRGSSNPEREMRLSLRVAMAV